MNFADKLNLLPKPKKTPADFASKSLELALYGSLF